MKRKQEELKQLGATKRNKKPTKDREKKRDDRYIIVIDQRNNNNKLYLYPPYILIKDIEGKCVMIKHRKKIIPTVYSDDSSTTDTEGSTEEEGKDEGKDEVKEKGKEMEPGHRKDRKMMILKRMG